MVGACTARTVSHFKWCDRPPARRVSIAPGTVAVRCESRAPVTCPGATFKGPDLHNIQSSVSGRPAVSSRTQPGAAIATSYELTQGCGALRTNVYSKQTASHLNVAFPPVDVFPAASLCIFRPSNHTIFEGGGGGEEEREKKVWDRRCERPLVNTAQQVWDEAAVPGAR